MLRNPLVVRALSRRIINRLFVDSKAALHAAHSLIGWVDRSLRQWRLSQDFDPRRRHTEALTAVTGLFPYLMALRTVVSVVDLLVVSRLMSSSNGVIFPPATRSIRSRSKELAFTVNRLLSRYEWNQSRFDSVNT